MYYDKGFKKLIFTGGEPLLHPDLDELISFARQFEFELAMQTNGILLTKNRVKELKKAGLDQILISIHSHLSFVEDEIMSGKNVLEKQLKGLVNANEEGITCFLTLVITKHNYKKFPDFCEFMISKYPFVKHFSFNFVDPVGRAKGNKNEVPKYVDIEVPLGRALFKLKKANKTFRVERVPLCYMLEFAEYSTELRRIITKEPSIVYREEGRIHYVGDYFKAEYMKGKACEACWLNRICPGVNKKYVNIYGMSEVYPIFIKPDKIVEKAGVD